MNGTKYSQTTEHDELVLDYSGLFKVRETPPPQIPAEDRSHQDNTRKSEQLQAEILKGIRAGEDIYSLFLKAARAIGNMTTEHFYTQAERELMSIYGDGLRQRPPLQLERNAAERRLQRLRDSLETETDTKSRDRICAAITAHENRIHELDAQLEEARQ